MLEFIRNFKRGFLESAGSDWKRTLFLAACAVVVVLCNLYDIFHD